jgi:hypothetical protein
MNQCLLCNPDKLAIRNEAYRLLAEGCSLAAVAKKLDLSYNSLFRCWHEHDMDPIRNTYRRIEKAKKRYVKAEHYHRTLKETTPQSRLELDAALNQLRTLEQHLKMLKDPGKDQSFGKRTVTIEELDRLIQGYDDGAKILPNKPGIIEDDEVFIPLPSN